MRRAVGWAPGAVAGLGLLLVCGVPLGYAVRDAVAAGRWPVVDARSAELLLNSVWVAAGSAVVACVLGVPVGLAVGRLRTRGQRMLACLGAVPFLIPPYAAAMSWIELTGAGSVAAQTIGRPMGWIYSPWGATWVLGACWSTLPAAAVVLAAYSGAWSGLGPARHARGGMTVLRRIVLPAVRPYVAISGVIVFLFCLAEFAVPSLLMVPVYPVEIHTQFSASNDPGAALAASTPLVLAGLVILAGAVAYSRRVARPLGERTVAHADLPPSAQRACTAVSCGALLFAAGLPLYALIVRAESFEAVRDAWETAGREIGASAMIGVGAATMCAVLGFAFVNSSQRAGWRYLGGFVASLTFLLPGPAIGIALISAWNHSGPRAWVYDGPAVLVLACAARLLIVAAIVVAVSRVSSAREWEDAARVFAVPAWRRQLWIALPASAPALVVAWAVVFVLSAREADASVLVAPPGFTTIAVRLLSLMHYGPSPVVAALSLLLVGLTTVSAAVLAGAAWSTIRWVYGASVRS